MTYICELSMGIVSGVNGVHGSGGGAKTFLAECSRFSFQKTRSIRILGYFADTLELSADTRGYIGLGVSSIRRHQLSSIREVSKYPCVTRV